MSLPPRRAATGVAEVERCGPAEKGLGPRRDTPTGVPACPRATEQGPHCDDEYTHDIYRNHYNTDTLLLC